MRRFALSMAALLVTVLAPLEAQLTDSVARSFVGTWRLVSWSQRLTDGTTRHDPRTVAHIIYTPDGRMCSLGMDPRRSRWQSATSPTPDEALAAAGKSAFYAYCANVEVNASEGFVLHHVEIDRSPNAVGSVSKRWFTFQGTDRVALRVDPSELTAPVVESTLTWERVTQ